MEVDKLNIANSWRLTCIMTGLAFMMNLLGPHDGHCKPSGSLCAIRAHEFEDLGVDLGCMGSFPQVGG
jgi:hypothetical protein